MKKFISSAIFASAIVAACLWSGSTAAQAQPRTLQAGAQRNVPAPMAADPSIVDNTMDSLNIVKMARIKPGSSRKEGKPVLFLLGDSTMRTGTRGNGDNGQWGWGFYFQEYFDTDKITVENQALGGTSSRSYYKQLWPDILAAVKPGDWVFIQFGHNDNGPYDSGRARAPMKGISTESLEVTIQETGKKDTVYSFGEYMRKFIRDIRAKGANPVLLSMTPRNSWSEDGKVGRVSETFGLWNKQVAEEMKVPYIDLNDITASTYESWVKYGGLQAAKNKSATMYYGDGLHTSAFGAKLNSESALAGMRADKDLSFLTSCLKPAPEDRFGANVGRQSGKPVIFVTGDSTAKNNDKGETGMWGWGSVLSRFVDASKATVNNQAMAGRSARTFLDEGRWDAVYNAIEPGDIVFIQFGHNDGAEINTGKARGELRGSSDSSKVFMMERTRRNQVVYTYGWYIRKFANDVKVKGGIPVVLSCTPRNDWNADGTLQRVMGNYTLWAKESAERVGAYFIDLNDISYQKLYKIGNKEEVAKYFEQDHTHTSLKGAELNASSVVEGVKASPSIDPKIKSLFK